MVWLDLLAVDIGELHEALDHHAEPDLPGTADGDHLAEFVDLRHVAELVHDVIDVPRQGLPGQAGGDLDEGLVGAEDEQAGKGVARVLFVGDLQEEGRLLDKLKMD